MSYFVVDIESDGPVPPDFSMVCFGAALVDRDLKTTFYGKTRPISDRFNPDALAISGFSREQLLTFDDPKTVMQSFADWLNQNFKGRPFSSRTMSRSIGNSLTTTSTIFSEAIRSAFPGAASAIFMRGL